MPEEIPIGTELVCEKESSLKVYFSNDPCLVKEGDTGVLTGKIGDVCMICLPDSGLLLRMKNEDISGVWAVVP